MGKPTGLAKDQQLVLGRLSAVKQLRGFYLAGGSAIALYLGHRRSLDLDLFSVDPSASLSRVKAAVAAIPGANVLKRSDVMLRFELSESLVDVVIYPYAPLEAPKPGPGGFPIAGLRDLAAMKISAISSRGIRRDFWDVSVMAQHGLSLRMAVEAYRERYSKDRLNVYHVLRSLTYFDDAEKDEEMPEGLTASKWTKIKAFFLREAPKLVFADEG